MSISEETRQKMLEKMTALKDHNTLARIAGDIYICRIKAFGHVAHLKDVMDQAIDDAEDLMVKAYERSKGTAVKYD